MTETTHDEETPLLPGNQQKKKVTPLPWGQFSILIFLQLAEPFTSHVINPFAPQLIRDVGVTHGDETKVGHYVGVMQSIFFATQALTVLHWSRLSDHLGRKPIILTGLFGLSLSMFSFGLSKTYWGAVVSRSLNGALNGNIGVLKSMIAEITDSTNLAYAYAYLPISWSTGQAIGPAVGGYFSHPADQFPELFGSVKFLKEYPYFLACAIPATFSAIAWIVTLVFLKETVQSPYSLRRFVHMRTSKANLTFQNVASGHDNRVGPAGTMEEIDKSDANKPVPLKTLITTPKVATAALNYATLALVDIAIRSVQPVFLSTPIELGGLGLPPYQIGRILSIYGVLNGFLQIFCFAQVHNRWGARRVYIWSLASALLVVSSFPLINMLARAEGSQSPMVWVAVAYQVLSSLPLNFAYGCIFVFITASAPNRASLGTVNGFCQVGVSMMRTVGPAISNSLFSLSIDENYHYLGGNLVYAALVALTCLSLICADYLPKDTNDAAR